MVGMFSPSIEPTKVKDGRTDDLKDPGLSGTVTGSNRYPPRGLKDGSTGPQELRISTDVVAPPGSE